MLRQALLKVEAAARQAAAAAEAANMRTAVANARVVADQLVPEALGRREQILAFAARAQVSLESTLRLYGPQVGADGLQRAAAVDAAKGAFAELAQSLAGLNTGMAQTAAHAAQIRALLELGLAELEKRLADIRQRLAADAAMIAAAERSAAENNLRSSLSWLGGPLGKGIDELISLIQTGGSTEQALSRALQDLERTRADVRQLENMLGPLMLLRDSAGAVASRIQLLANGVAIAHGHIQNAWNDLSEAAQLELFCHAAAADIADLRNDAS